jgi:hypothetical protein
MFHSKVLYNLRHSSKGMWVIELKGSGVLKSGKDEKFKNVSKIPEANKHRRRWEDTFKKGDGSTLGIELDLDKSVMLLCSE